MSDQLRGPGPYMPADQLQRTDVLTFAGEGPVSMVRATAYDQLLAERDALAVDLAQMNQLCESLQNKLASRPLTGADTTELEARCDAAELDAERYRWLRGRAWSEITYGELEYCQQNRTFKPSFSESVDAAIDEAIKRK